MLLQTIEALFRKYRLFCYQKLFAAVREKPGSLSATEAFSADIIHLLGSPTISPVCRYHRHFPAERDL